MKFKNLMTLIFAVSLAIIANGAMAKGHSNKKEASAKHSEKSVKSAKSCKSGIGSINAKHGRGYEKSRGRGRNAIVCEDDGTGDDDKSDDVVLVCAGPSEFSATSPEDTSADEITFTAMSCDELGSDLAIPSVLSYPDEDPVDPFDNVCEPSEGGLAMGLEQQTNSTEYWWVATLLMECEAVYRNQ